MCSEGLIAAQFTRPDNTIYYMLGRCFTEYPVQVDHVWVQFFVTDQLTYETLEEIVDLENDANQHWAWLSGTRCEMHISEVFNLSLRVKYAFGPGHQDGDFLCSWMYCGAGRVFPFVEQDMPKLNKMFREGSLLDFPLYLDDQHLIQDVVDLVEFDNDTKQTLCALFN